MTSQRATRLINAPLSQVRDALLDPRALPEWNPAFRTVAGPVGAATGVSYPITVRGGLTGAWQYATIEDQRIDTTWRVPGFHENGTWRFERHGPDTLVTHEFRHEGPLARLLSNAYRGVAELRLDRLAQRAAGRRRSPNHPEPGQSTTCGGGSPPTRDATHPAPSILTSTAGRAVPRRQGRTGHAADLRLHRRGPGIVPADRVVDRP
jgi:uncharacterized protein YndB with AHSA1/START domain